MSDFVKTVGWATMGLYIGLVLLQWGSWFAGVDPNSSNATIERGWLEHKGKIYRVIPAEVR